MRVIIDTNVIASATFWQGVPQELLKAAFRGSVDMIITKEILDEYERVLASMGRQYDSVDDALDVLDTIKKQAGWCTPAILPESVCDDKDDDKFIAAAIASRSPVIISGDKLLLSCSGYRNIEIIRPKQFIDAYL